MYRIYRQLELNLRIKPKRRIKRDKPDALQVPINPNQVWSMDFMSDSLVDGRTLRTFNVVDDYNREGLGIEVDLSLPSTRVIRSLEHIIEWRGKPDALRCDNGPEYISQALIDWASERQITLMYTQPGKPTQNAYIERFNRTARHEWLDLHLFESVEHAQNLATEWLWTYNNVRPHSAIGGVPPRRLTEAAYPLLLNDVWNGGITDNFDVAQELESLLASWGMDVTHVLSVQMLEEACIEEGAFDLIVADYHLGLINETGLDSIRLLKQKQTTHAVQSVLISGDTSNDLAQLAKQENVLLLAKPIRPARFRVLLNQLLAGWTENIH